MVKVTGVPLHPFAAAVAVMVAVTGLAVALVAVKEAMFPEPLAASPMEAVLFVQLKVAPAVVLVKLMAVVVEPLHNV